MSLPLFLQRLCCYCLVIQSCATLCDLKDYTAHQAPLSICFSRQEYWSGLPFTSPKDWLWHTLTLLLCNSIYILVSFFHFVFSIQLPISKSNYFKTIFNVLSLTYCSIYCTQKLFLSNSYLLLLWNYCW